MIHVRTTVADDRDVAGDIDRPRARIGHGMVRDGGRAPQLVSGLRIESMEDAIHRGYEDLAFPDRNASIDEVAARVARGTRIRLRIKLPDLPAGGRVDRIDEAPGTGGVHDPVDHDRRRLLAPRCAEIVGPGKPEAVDIAFVYRGEGREIGLVLIAPQGEPVLRLAVRAIQSRLIDVTGGSAQRGHSQKQRCSKAQRRPHFGKPHDDLHRLMLRYLGSWRPQRIPYARTRRDPRLSHNCDCFDRFCRHGVPTKRAEFPEISALASLCVRVTCEPARSTRNVPSTSGARADPLGGNGPGVHKFPGRRGRLKKGSSTRVS